MSTEMTTDVRAIMDRTPFDKMAVADLIEVLGRDPSRYKTLQEAVRTIQDRHPTLDSDQHLRLGVAYVLLGHYRTGCEHLKQAGDLGMSWYFRGMAEENLNDWESAASTFDRASELDYKPETCRLHRAGALRFLGRTEESLAILDELKDLDGRSAEYHFQRGSLMVDDGEQVTAAVEFEKALELDRDHTGALFRLAFVNDLQGNDREAIDLYRRCTERPPVPISALINLGILYEDENKIEEAKACYERVLAVDPTHPRAALYHRDCVASDNEVIDVGTETLNRYYKKQLSVPVTDFELSVRSRNCLRKMHIRSLGDLTRITERTLLDSKNFGETSLNEIKEMMSSKNLKLGMALDSGQRPAAPTQARGGAMDLPETMSPEEREVRGKPISDLALSVRARKCMAKLNVQTVGDLMSYTADQLLESKNFGVTSLNEVRKKLEDLGVKLKND